MSRRTPEYQISLARCFWIFREKWHGNGAVAEDYEARLSDAFEALLNGNYADLGGCGLVVAWLSSQSRKSEFVLYFTVFENIYMGTLALYIEYNNVKAAKDKIRSRSIFRISPPFQMRPSSCSLLFYLHNRSKKVSMFWSYFSMYLFFKSKFKLFQDTAFQRILKIIQKP